MHKVKKFVIFYPYAEKPPRGWICAKFDTGVISQTFQFFAIGYGFLIVWTGGRIYLGDWLK